MSDMGDQDATAGHQSHPIPCYFPALLPALSQPDPPPDDAPSAPDRPPLNNRDSARPAKVQRSYSPTERMGLVWLAIRDGVFETSRAHGVPRATLQGWMEKENTSVTRTRQFLEEKTLADYLTAERAIYTAVVMRGPWLPADDLLMTFRKLVEARTGLLVSQAQPAQAGAAAQAQASVTLQIQEKDGEVKMVELGPPPEEV